MLKPVCLVPCPFDTPLILGLNFFRISDVKTVHFGQKTKKQLCHSPTLPSSVITAKDRGRFHLLGNVVTLSSVPSPPMLMNEEQRNKQTISETLSMHWAGRWWPMFCLSPPWHSSVLGRQLQQILCFGTKCSLQAGADGETEALSLHVNSFIVNKQA